MTRIAPIPLTIRPQTLRATPMPPCGNHPVAPDGGPRVRGRKDRRGLSALAATLLLAMVLSAGFATWARFAALRIRDADIVSTTRWAGAEARALHHWLHDAQAQPSFALPGVGRARLDAASGLSPYRPAWLVPPRGWTVRYVIANPRQQANNPENSPDGRRAHGILVIERPRPDGNRRAETRDRAMLHALCAALAPALPAAAARVEALARQALALDAVEADFGGGGGTASVENGGTAAGVCDPDAVGRFVAIAAAPHAGINTDLVLREPRSGFAPQVMQAGIAMGGCGIVGAGQAAADRVAIPPGDADAGEPTMVLVAAGNAPGAPPADCDDEDAAADRPGPVTVLGDLTMRGDGLAATQLHALGASVSGTLRTVENRTEVSGRIVAETMGSGEPVGTLRLTGPGPADRDNPAIRARTLTTGECRGC